MAGTGSAQSNAPCASDTYEQSFWPPWWADRGDVPGFQKEYRLPWPIDHKKDMRFEKRSIPQSKDLLCHLMHLYVEENLSARLVSEIGWQVYGFKPNDSLDGGCWYRLAFKKKQKPSRAAAHPKPPTLTVPFAVVLVRDGFTFRSRINGPFSFRRFRPQEEILHYIDSYVHSIFDPKGCAWSIDLIEFARNGDSCTKCSLEKWQLLSDQSYGASTLINSKLPIEAHKTLDNFLLGIRKAASYNDPSILVKLWRICLGIRGIDGRGKQFRALHRLYSSLEEVLSHKASQEKSSTCHALVNIIKALRTVDQEDFRSTLRIGFDKTLTTMVSLFGDENAMVLHMWSIYFKYWDKQYLSPSTFFLKFDHVWHKVHRSAAYSEEQVVAVDYYFTYALYYLAEDDVRQCESHVKLETLLKLTDDYLQKKYINIKKQLAWTLPTLAFAFSARTLAQTYRNQGELAISKSIMERAIDMLENGDRECLIRAVMLGQILTRWLVQWSKAEEAEKQSDRVSKNKQRLDSSLASVS